MAERDEPRTEESQHEKEIQEPLPHMHKEHVILVEFGECRQHYLQPFKDQYIIHTFELQRDDVRQVIKYISEHHVKAVLAFVDGAVMFLGILKRIFPHIRGPSLEATIMCNNKLYTHKFIDPNPIPHCFVDLREEVELKRESIRKMFDTFGVPIFMKPTTGGGSEDLALANTEQDVIDVIRKMRENRKTWRDMWRPLFDRFGDDVTFPMYESTGALAMKYIKHPNKLSIEGFVFEGKDNEWLIGDYICWPKNPQVLQMVVFPSMQSEKVKQKARALCKLVVERLIKRGFDNQFYDAEFLIDDDDDDVRLMEFNGRVGGFFKREPEICLENGDVIEAMLGIATGKRPKTPSYNGGQCGHCSVRAIQDGVVDEVINWDVLNTAENITVVVDRKEQIRCTSESGYLLGYYTISGSYMQVLAYHKDFLSRLFKDPNYLSMLQ